MKYTVKTQLLKFLSIADYFRAKRNMKRDAMLHMLPAELSADINPVGFTFMFHASPEGVPYWKDRQHRKNPVQNSPLQAFIKWIIRILPFLMVIICLSACQKDKQVEPKKQTVYYSVQCADCLIYLESQKWNGHNELERSKNQYFNVTGVFNYQFDNIDLDSVKFSVSVSVFSPKQYIKVLVYTNDGHKTELNGWYGLDYPNDNPLQREGFLNLK